MMNTRYIFMLCLCAALLFGAFQAGVSAETEIDRTSRRDPFISLLGTTSDDQWSGPLPSGNQNTVLQQYGLKQFRVLGIVLGELGHHAILLAPDGKRYMISVDTPIGLYDGVVTDIKPNSVQVKEIHRFVRGRENVTKEVESTLLLDPLKISRRPESRFVVVRN